MDPLSAYDIAFSLLTADLAIASQISAALPPELHVFLYSERQRELIVARDGLNAFPTVFRTARLCVVLYRESWGETPWTRLEQRAIADRYMEEGADFLVLVRLDHSIVPPWVPRTDIWIDLLTESAESAAGHLTARLLAGTGTSTRRTRHSLDRRSVPIARYQQAKGRSVSESNPWVPEVCDACSAAVQHRPLIRVGLQADGVWPATSEQLCPKCAADRGLHPMNNGGLTAEQLYGPRNPPAALHVSHALAQLLPSVAREAAFASRGVVELISGHAGNAGLIVAFGPKLPPAGVRVHIFPQDLNRGNVRDDTSLLDLVRARMLAELDAPHPTP